MSELAKAVEELGIKIESKHMGLVEGAWNHDKWVCTLIFNDRDVEVEFSTGIGHRKLSPNVTKVGCTYTDVNGYRNYNDLDAAKKGYTKPTGPEVADVVYNLLSDASVRDQTYKGWCKEFGYDSDSRKALDTYLKCQDNYELIRNLLGRDNFEFLAGLEH